MFGALYVAAYLLIRKVGDDGVKMQRVSPRIREITAKLPESQRQAKADELWNDPKFVQDTLTESYREKNWPMAIFFYTFWGAISALLCYWAFWPLLMRWVHWYFCINCG